MDLVLSRKKNGSYSDICYIDFTSLDCAWGSEENDFELIVPMSEDRITSNDLINLEVNDGIKSYQTQIGGIIDTMSIDTESREKTYTGRTWSGILASRVFIKGAQGDGLYINKGSKKPDAGQVVNGMLELLELDGFFSCDTKTGYSVEPYEITRFVDGYTALLDFCEQNLLKPLFFLRNGKVFIDLVAVRNYSDENELYGDKVAFTIERHANPVNHVVIGSSANPFGPMMNLYTDRNGNVYNYVKVNPPLKDAHYIKSRSTKPLGADTRTRFVDADAEETEKYELLETMPKDWYKGDKYYSVEYDEETGEESYELIEPQDTYESVTLTDTEFAKYYSGYYKKVNGKYKALEGSEQITSYKALTEMPAKWKSEYKKYYTKRYDGTQTIYSAVSGVSKDYYKPHTKKPSDWSTNYKAYYYLSSESYQKLTSQPSDWSTSCTKYYMLVNKKYIHVKKLKNGNAPQFSGSRRYYKKVAKAEYKQISSEKTPHWRIGKYYTRYTKTKAPAFEKSTYYRAVKSIVAPSKPSTIYKKVEKAPKFVPNTYYKQVIDRYESLVAEGLKVLEEEWSADSATIDINGLDEEFDVLDKLALSDIDAGISCILSISKKIAKIENGMLFYEYDVDMVSSGTIENAGGLAEYGSTSDYIQFVYYLEDSSGNYITDNNGNKIEVGDITNEN